MGFMHYVRQFIHTNEDEHQPTYRILRVTDLAGFPKEDADSVRLRGATFSDLWLAHRADEITHEIKPILFLEYLTDGDGNPKLGYLHTSMIDSMKEENGKYFFQTAHSIYVIRRE